MARGVEVAGGEGGDDWVERAEASGTIPRTLDIDSALADIAPLWVAHLEPWPGSPGDGIPTYKAFASLYEDPAPPGVEVVDELDDQQYTLVEQTISSGQLAPLGTATGWHEPGATTGDLDRCVFAEMDLCLVAYRIGVHVEADSIRPEMDSPERLLLAGVAAGRPFVWRRQLNGPAADEGPARDVALGRAFKLLALAESFYDSFEAGETGDE